ncbi:hypothetical protein ACEZHJ_04005 [Arhodomonas sp. KWT2]|uniref:hypothetical protein n=1 Tax=unclassified Arhodomonas TaxID=2621637 RepID=UPI0013D3AF9E|nr:hypothetical protein [Arhodomonas sp. KWT]
MNRLRQNLFLLVALIFLILGGACSEDPNTAKVKNEVKNFKRAQELYFNADRYLKEITGGNSIVGSFSEDERNTYINKLSIALKEAKLVSDGTLYKLHPKLPEAYHSIFIPCIEKQLKGFAKYDPKASIEGQILHDAWIDWWNGNYKEFRRL